MTNADHEREWKAALAALRARIADLEAENAELLAACEHLVNVVDDPVSELKSLCDAIAQAKATAAKAKGGRS